MASDPMFCSQKLSTPPDVSICCFTFNHAPYIRDAISGFLSQATHYSFEIIIHDDASTDATPSIIQEFAAIHPGVIRPILRTTNTYSVNRGNLLRAVLSESKGRYLAFCEGDDYWCSADKLQQQISQMEKFPGPGISFHPVTVLDAEASSTPLGVLADYGKDVFVFSAADVVRGGGGFMPSPSLVIRADVARKFPAWMFDDLPVGDYFLQMLAALPGGALYLPSNHAVYRANGPGSWSRTAYSSFMLRKKNLYGMHEGLSLFNDYTRGQYKTDVAASLAVELDRFSSERSFVPIILTIAMRSRILSLKDRARSLYRLAFPYRFRALIARLRSPFGR